MYVCMYVSVIMNVKGTPTQYNSEFHFFSNGQVYKYLSAYKSKNKVNMTYIT